MSGGRHAQFQRWMPFLPHFSRRCRRGADSPEVIPRIFTALASSHAFGNRASASNRFLILTASKKLKLKNFHWNFWKAKFGFSKTLSSCLFRFFSFSSLPFQWSLRNKNGSCALLLFYSNKKPFTLGYQIKLVPLFTFSGGGINGFHRDASPCMEEHNRPACVCLCGLWTNLSIFFCSQI